ncbi:hypothetical protein J2R99_000063 [Rhodopseudomonas julia]|uniref:Uncharacterized protein n=1 Tax=Rhodopseudomonas julia TaxID=200617 RepID=A0ABU0C131_9BRAD|nr:DUF6634 family protein [Rhodopseudomonas julia]MDQ0324214.1 hypothetical protein [Rhodopseudomonas julia]
MHILEPHGFTTPFGRDLERAEGLVADLRALHEGRIPTPQNLVNAPLIDRWSFVTIPGTALIGHVFGHPLLGTREVLTSAVWVAAPGHGFVRTLSRYYRLGLPADETEVVS